MTLYYLGMLLPLSSTSSPHPHPPSFPLPCSLFIRHQVMCDRHFGGINYPVGGVGRIPEELVEGLKAFGGEVWYGANVKQVLLDPDTKRAVSEGRMGDVMI